MNKLKFVHVLWDGKQVGRIGLTPDGLCIFEYETEFIRSGTSISPFELPLRPGVQLARRSPFEGNFGVFDDCLPDGWGALMLDRYLQKQGIDIRSLDALQLLSLVGSTGRGALEFYPDNSSLSAESFSEIEALAQLVSQILLSEDYSGRGIEELYHRGGSPGGARPKIFMNYDGAEWLVKFPGKFDSASIGEEEYEYSLLAKKCGIEMPETRLFEGKYFGARRFDRTADGKKLHVVSVAGLIGADYRTPSIDYHHIFQICNILTHNIPELWKVYRLMAFNFLISNLDDHAKNFSFIYRDGSWHLSPAFDLTASYGINGYRTTSINGSIQPTQDDLLALASTFSLDPKKALSILSQMSELI